MKKKLYVSQVKDAYVQQNFKAIGDIFNANPYLKGQWVFKSITITTTGTDVKLEHNLPFIPTDILVTSTINGTIVFKYASFDATFIVFDATVTTSPMTVRAFIGRYTEDSVNV